MKNIFVFVLIALFFSSCVGKKKYLDLVLESHTTKEQLTFELSTCRKENDDLRRQLAACQDDSNSKDRALATTRTELSNANSKITKLEEEVAYFKNSNTNLLDRLSDLSVLSKTGAESIKQTLETLNEQNKYIKDLNSNLRVKDSLNLALVLNLKRSLGDVNDEDITIEVKKGVVYISISDKMLFRSGSAEVRKDAETVLGKIAKVVNDHSAMDILVEGHTDNVPISSSCITDNWDLSVKRATSVVRILQSKHGVNPARMTAGGRSEFLPKADNATSNGRSMNRRTEIIVLPKLDQFFELLKSPGTK